MRKLKIKLIDKIILPIGDIMMKTSFSKKYKTIQKLSVVKQNDIIQWQNDKLQDLIMFAYSNTCYYKKLFDENNIKPEEIYNIECLSRVPILTKKLIKDNFYELIPKNINSIPHKRKSTGGSTGDPLKYYQSNDSWSFVAANNRFNWELTDYNYGDKFIALGSTSINVNKKQSFKHKIYYSIKNKLSLSGINMSDEICEKYCKLIKYEKIRYIYGYASSIFVLANYSIRENKNLKIDACFTTSEILRNEFRITIKKAFRCRILDCYGANDGGITAFSLEPNIFKVGYNCLVRIDSYNNHSSIGDALLTDLLNFAMPLINYKIGDVVELMENKDASSFYNGQILKQVIGRTSEIMRFDNGSVLTGPAFTILFKDIPVNYYCIEKINDHKVICWLQRQETFDENHNDLIYKSIMNQLGKGINLDIKDIEKPFVAKSGKRLYMKVN